MKSGDPDRYNQASLLKPIAMSSSHIPSAAALDHSPLGQASLYVDQYDKSLLFPIARSLNRDLLSSDTARPRNGVDIWTAYELSWLNTRGKPQVATATFSIPANTPHLIESKSFKLYLNSFNQTRYADADALAAVMTKDLSQAAGAAINVTIHAPSSFENVSVRELQGIDLDAQDIDIDAYLPDANLLALDATGKSCSEVLVSRLLKSNCPVTGQPDWGSIQISYSGRALDRAQLLRYIVSFRQHAGFHEHCVETIFDDIMRVCAPTSLTVYARYTRRGGLDINPWRSSTSDAAPTNVRTARQ